MAISERSVADATLMAIEELNARGGVLGRKLEPVLVDGASQSDQFARLTEQLISHDNVKVIFGCWTSASRRTVVPVLEKHNHLMFYPVQYEGLEQSSSVVYTGAAPNQQLIPAINWCFDKLKARRFFLVGSDYVYPRTANAIARLQITARGGTVVGENYLLLGSQATGPVARQAVAARPDVILNTINGDTNLAFFRELRAAGVTPARTPTVSFSLAEDELRHMDSRLMAGDYAAWNYFQSLESPRNRDFVARFQRRYGSDRVTDDPIEAAYVGVYLWAQAATEAGSPEVADVRGAIGGQSYPAPGGPVSVDPATQHTWKRVRIGQIEADGQFKLVWSSQNLVQPEPFPFYRSPSEWAVFLQRLQDGWGGAWANSGK